MFKINIYKVEMRLYLNQTFLSQFHPHLINSSSFEGLL